VSTTRSALIATYSQAVPRRADRTTLLCNGRSRSFWQEFWRQPDRFRAASLSLTTPAGTRTRDRRRPGAGAAGGTGHLSPRAPRMAPSTMPADWAGVRRSSSGYEIGRRAIARALLELQGWAPPSRLSATVRDQTHLADAGANHPALLSRHRTQPPDRGARASGAPPR